jgi:hypothetical protein
MYVAINTNGRHFCVFMTNIVRRRRHNVTLYPHCLPYYLLPRELCGLKADVGGVTSTEVAVLNKKRILVAPLVDFRVANTLCKY